MFKTRNTALAVIAGLAILSAVTVPGLLTTGNVFAQLGNQTTTVAPQGNETSSSAASITLTPSTGAAGSNFTIAGTGFTSGQTFNFTFDQGYLLTGNMVQFASGDFNTTALVPENVTGGDHEVMVAGSNGENATSTFTVSGAGNATSSGGAAAGGNDTSMTTPSGNETSVGSDANSTTISPPSINSTSPLIQPQS